MKFMKLGSKPDSFQTDGNDVRIVGTELASDLIIHVGDVNFHLHKFSLLSKCGHIQKLLSSDTAKEIHLKDVPGGATSFGICAKFCYGTSITLNPHNVVSTRCAAEFLEMSESIEKGNLIYKIDVFLSSSVFKGWKDSIIALQTMKTLQPWSEDLKLVRSCMDAISSKASADVARVDWSYTYNRKKVVPNAVPKDWFVEDLTEIELEYFKNIIAAIKMRGRVSHRVVGEAIKAYTYKRVPSLSRVSIIQGDFKVKSLVETVTLLLPCESSVSCSFLLKLLRAACMLKCSETCKKELVKRTGKQLEEASVNDLLIPTMDGEVTVYDIDVVLNIVEEFVMQDDNKEELSGDVKEMAESGVILRTSKGLVAKLVDGYLAEVAKDPNMPLSKFLDLAEMVSSQLRPVHDGLYRAVDIFLKEHPDITKGEKKKLCALLDCKKLSADASAHAVQNERLPLRLVVQVLFLEQSRSNSSSASASASATSYGSSRSITTTNVTSEDDNWDGTGVIIGGTFVKDVNGLNGGINQDNKLINGMNCVNDVKVVKGVNGINGGVNGVKKIIGRIMQGRGSGGVSSGSDSSGSPEGSRLKEKPVKATPAGTEC